MNQGTAGFDNVVATIIPYNNKKALSSYYCGVFSIIPGLGAVLGPLAIVLGIGGRKLARENPSAKGGAHAMTGIVTGVLGGVISYGIGILLLVLVVGKGD